MNTAALARLAQSAKSWAAAYVALKEELLKQGVQEEEAIETARDVTKLVSLYEQDSGESCPLCGRGE